jgi:hypothetical protein
MDRFRFYKSRQIDKAGYKKIMRDVVRKVRSLFQLFTYNVLHPIHIKELSYYCDFWRSGHKSKRAKRGDLELNRYKRTKRGESKQRKLSARPKTTVIVNVPSVSFYCLK